MIRWTNEDFIKKSIEVWGPDKFDYSLVEYKRQASPVTLICKEHREQFEQKPMHHFRGFNGCPKCKKIIPWTKETFIDKAKEVHGDRYDYSKVEWTGIKSKIKIVCNKHDYEFEQQAAKHAYGQGCPKCRFITSGNRRRLKHDDIIKQFTNVHGNMYDYSLVEYVKKHKPVRIICNKHGEFLQTPNNHYRGAGCPSCGRDIVAKLKTLTQEEFERRIRSLYGDQFDLSEAVYINNSTDVEFICKDHGTVYARPANAFNGKLCRKCSGIMVKNTEDFVEQADIIHDGKYDYSKVEYVRSAIKVSIRCKEHDIEFLQTPNGHLGGSGCPLCKGSRLEDKVSKLLSERDVLFIPEKRFEGCRAKRTLPFDFYLPDDNVLIECQGRQHYQVEKFFGGEERYKERQEYDRIKRDFCEKEGITLVEIPYWFTDQEIEKVISHNINKV